VLGCVQRHISEKGVDGGEADVATAGAIVAFLFEMIEEGAEERSVQIGQRQGRGRFAKLSLRILQQQTEGIPVAGESVGAHLSLSHEAVDEERLQQSREWIGGFHGKAPRSDGSTRKSACRNSSGVAVRYQ
jgi:hypothetical protein